MRRPYACGHSGRELGRLEFQGAFYEAISRGFLERAGLARGQRVLDIGCGVGDLSLLAAEMVGPSGWVLGVDRAAGPIRAARARASRLGLRHVEFRRSEIEALRIKHVDALVGRFVLMHQAQPARTLRAAAGHVRPRGIVAVLESHMSASVAGVHSWPHSPTYARMTGWIRKTLEAVGANVDMGLRLRQTFVEAGLPSPELWLQARVEGGAEAAIPRYVAESLRSVLPRARRFGVTRITAADVDGLESLLREELTQTGGVLTSPLVVGAWCRVSPRSRPGRRACTRTTL